MCDVLQRDEKKNKEQMNENILPHQTLPIIIIMNIYTLDMNKLLVYVT